jgi:hypothetical protein
VASLTKLSLLEDPGLKAVTSKFAIEDGRLKVQPFDVGIGPTSMRVSGSNGVDQSIDYDLSLKVPRSLLGKDANQAISGLVSKAAGAGINLDAAQEIALGIKLGGTVTSPSVSTDVESVAGSTVQTAGKAVQDAAEQKASAEATKLLADAEKQAASIRAEANTLAEKVKKEGYAQADALVAKSQNPLAQAAAKLGADQLRKETDAKAAGIVKEADKKASSLVAEAKKKTAAP